ncbi:MAG: serine/threonine-protein kinase RIO2 [Candidatus Bathyarchaeia archaeon]
MSSADIAVKVFRKLQPPDFRILLLIEAGMRKYQYVPEDYIVKLSNMGSERVIHILSQLNKMRLIRRWRGTYQGYVLNMAGYDCLAINAFVKAGVLEAFGKPLGVGKEADVYDALTPQNERIAIKFHRLGRTSFRQTRKKRDYAANRRHISWLYQSRLAAKKEYQALKMLYPHQVAVPEPILHNRHAIVMGIIEGVELADFSELPQPKEIFNEILSNVKKAYVKAGIIHADLSEFNILLKPDRHILIIDWPQYVTCKHPNAEQLLKRDVQNVIGFFNRKHKLKISFKEALDYVKDC